MDIIIDSVTSNSPQDSQLLNSQGTALLNFLASLDYETQNPPLADLLRRQHKLRGNWLIVSPMHWEATHNDAMIVASVEQLSLDEVHSRELFAQYAAYLAQENIQLYYHDAATWLMCCDDKPLLNAKPIYQLLNQSLMPELAKLDATMYWQKLFTEAQMFFAQLNTEINGVWFWGNALLQDKKSVSVCVDEEFTQLAQLLASQVIVNESSVSLKKCSLMLLKNLPSEEFTKTPANWYWNNTAYSTKSRNLFTRIWRTLFHAH